MLISESRDSTTGIDTGDDNNKADEEEQEQDNQEDADEACNAWEDDVELDITREPGDYGKAKIYKMDNDKMHAISYPDLYRYRGEELKSLNRLEYCALVKVVENKSRNNATTTSTPSRRGRKKNKAFHFGKGLREKIGSKYHQILLSKQCTPKFFGKMPTPPGKKPSDPSQLLRWQKRAEQFAFHYLTMFRPEDKLYEAGQKCPYEYSWEAFLEFESELRSSNLAIDHSRLEMMERMVHAWKVDPGKRIILMDYRGRNRTKWSEEQKGVARASRIMEMQNHSDVLDYCCDEFAHTELSAGQQKKNAQISRHKNECVTILNKCAPNMWEEQKSTVDPNSSYCMTLPFDDMAYTDMKSAQPNVDCDDDDKAPSPFPPKLSSKVDKYLKEQSLSSDKDRAVSILRDHFTAIYEGRSQSKDYVAPFLLVCGGPGNGKSKLVETFDGMSSRMDVGRLVKTAFVGGAAVNIDGSSLIDLFDIPIIDKDEGEGQMKRIKPWSDKKRKRFLQRYDLKRISCIIVDEISTVKPYMLAYLNARLMELYPESSKTFGGLAVVLLGDFDQLPPVGGNSLAGAAMKYEEQECTKAAKANNDELDDFLSGKGVATGLDIKAAGVLLFERAKYIKLTQQHRSKDPKHTALLERISRDEKIHYRALVDYKSLSEQDMSEDGEFAFATMVVTGNAERHELNAIQAKRWASQHNTKVVRWFRKRQDGKWKGKPEKPENVLRAMTEDCFYELFVPGAAGYLTENINTDIGLANGVEVKYHSLSFGTSEEDELFHDEFANSNDLIMTLDQPPLAVNVELYADFPGDSAAKKRENAKKRREWTHGSLVEGQVVVQISKQWGQLVRKWETENVDGSWRLGYDGSTVPMKDYFPIEPAFCVTIYKAQVSFDILPHQ